MACASVPEPDSLSLVECPVCLEVFENPKQLSCGHTLCMVCVDQLPRYDSQIQCPECRTHSTVPAGGFPTNYALTKLVSLLTITDRQSFYNCMMCDKQSRPENTIICYTCSDMRLCSACAVTVHNGHDIQPMFGEQKTKKIKTKLAEECDQVHSSTAQYNVAATKTTRGEVSTDKVPTPANIPRGRVAGAVALFENSQRQTDKKKKSTPYKPVQVKRSINQPELFAPVAAQEPESYNLVVRDSDSSDSDSELSQEQIRANLTAMLTTRLGAQARSTDQLTPNQWTDYLERQTDKKKKSTPYKPVQVKRSINQPELFAPVAVQEPESYNLVVRDSDSSDSDSELSQEQIRANLTAPRLTAHDSTDQLTTNQWTDFLEELLENEDGNEEEEEDEYEVITQAVPQQIFYQPVVSLQIGPAIYQPSQAIYYTGQPFQNVVGQPVGYAGMLPYSYQVVQGNPVPQPLPPGCENVFR